MAGHATYLQSNTHLTVYPRRISPVRRYPVAARSAPATNEIPQAALNLKSRPPLISPLLPLTSSLAEIQHHHCIPGQWKTHAYLHTCRVSIFCAGRRAWMWANVERPGSWRSRTAFRPLWTQHVQSTLSRSEHLERRPAVSVPSAISLLLAALRAREGGAHALHDGVAQPLEAGAHARAQRGRLGRLFLALHVHASVGVAELPADAEVFAAGAAAGGCGQLFARRRVDGQAEEVGGLGEIRVPFAVGEEVEQDEEGEEEDEEEREEEDFLVVGGAARSVLLGAQRGVEVLMLAAGQGRDSVVPELDEWRILRRRYQGAARHDCEGFGHGW
nr:hypothetical protein CFP56_36453 [Quercus suber]